jgi:hypothetical protein
VVVGGWGGSRKEKKRKEKKKLELKNQIALPDSVRE